MNQYHSLEDEKRKARQTTWMVWLTIQPRRKVGEKEHMGLSERRGKISNSLPT